ncbi:MAG: M81 family metallopeptidase [Candidatus Latescibacterota bacterium]|nr:M81 family metallopeptidase [Candidatus Latescibacterota bacterium]
MRRIGIGQLLQETNSLNPVITTRDHFEDCGLVSGQRIVDDYRDTGELAGFTSLPDLLGEPVKWVGMARAVAWSGGPLQTGLLAEVISEMTESLASAVVDGVLLSLHGAQCAEDEYDVSGRVLQAVRSMVGPDIPIVATLDLHANVTPLMAECADVLVGYHTFPHIDHVSCGRRAATVLQRLLGGEVPSVSMWKIPMVVSAAGRATDTGVQRELWAEIVASEQRQEVLSTGLYMVQPWFDVPLLGWTLYQAWVDDGDPSLDPGAVGAACWDSRRHQEIEYVSPEDLIDRVRAIDGGPVAVSEGHDATNSGAPGDSTQLMAALIRQPIGDGGGLCFCVDPESVAACQAAGAGAKVDLTVGGKRDPFSEPLAVRATVNGTGNLRYTLSGHGGHNLPVDMGRYANIEVTDTTIVLVEKTGPGSSPLLFDATGVDPRAFKVVLAKSPEGFRADYEPFSSGILYAAAPGCATPFINEVDFQHTTKPLFPQDEIAAAEDAAWAGEIYQRRVHGKEQR